MKRGVGSILTAFSLAALAGAAYLAAQAQPQRPAGDAPVKIAFVNAQALLRGMPGFAKAESTWTKEAELAKAEAQRLQAGFDSAVAQYQQSQAMLSPSARSTREKQLQAQSDSLQAKIQGINDRVGQRERELLQPMQDRLKAILDGFRAEGNYAMIIDIGSASSIVSYDKSLDITVKVAQRLAQSN